MHVDIVENVCYMFVHFVQYQMHINNLFYPMAKQMLQHVRKCMTRVNEIISILFMTLLFLFCFFFFMTRITTKSLNGQKSELFWTKYKNNTLITFFIPYLYNFSNRDVNSRDPFIYMNVRID